MPYLTGQVLTQADIAALFTSGTYTPSLGGMAIGTGGTPINTAKYTFVGFPAGGVLTVEGKIKFGTTTVTLPGAITESIALPAGYSIITVDTVAEMEGNLTFHDISAGVSYKGGLFPTSSTSVQFLVWNVSGAVLAFTAVTATVPFTWAINDEIYYRFSVRCTGP